MNAYSVDSLHVWEVLQTVKGETEVPAMRRVKFWLYGVAFCACSIGVSTAAYGQSFGVELHNTLMPASGGMGGASVARPQDLTSAINANPATLTQFQGTQFMFG